MSDDNEPSYGLIMPFVVCQSNEGPYEDEAFVAGVYAGEISTVLAFGPPMWEGHVPSPLVPQVDLLAMRFGYSMSSQPWEEHPEDWTWVSLTKIEVPIV